MTEDNEFVVDDDPPRDIIGDPFDLPPLPPGDLVAEELELPTTPYATGKFAFHRGEYEEAIKQFTAVVKDAAYDEDSRVKASYYRIEAKAEHNLTEELIGEFEEISANFPDHHLAAAAQRRADALRHHFAQIAGEQ
ncbi:MAG: hypothetical protein O3A46_08665 [Candidatus Poribacteria bacterium]|nr:hypothetical protein [Candidatus Poribacteria bacterium]